MAKNKKIQDTQKRIEQLLEMAWDTESTARILAITSQILELDPNNIEALILKSDNTKDVYKRIEILNKALNSINTSKNLNDELKITYLLALNQRFSYMFLGIEEYDRALKCCETAIEITERFSSDPEEDENYEDMKSIRYRILIERNEWQRILSLTMKDEDHTPGWAYARLIAAWCLAPKPKEAACAKLFFDALISAPDVPFYMLGFFEEPDDNVDDEVFDDFNFAMMYYDVISISDEFHDWFSRGVVLFGLLSNRFEGKEREYMIDALDSLGGFHDFERMSKILVEGDDMAVIEAMAANKCLID